MLIVPQGLLMEDWEDGRGSSQMQEEVRFLQLQLGNLESGRAAEIRESGRAGKTHKVSRTLPALVSINILSYHSINPGVLSQLRDIR